MSALNSDIPALAILLIIAFAIAVIFAVVMLGLAFYGAWKHKHAIVMINKGWVQSFNCNDKKLSPINLENGMR